MVKTRRGKRVAGIQGRSWGDPWEHHGGGSDASYISFYVHIVICSVKCFMVLILMMMMINILLLKDQPNQNIYWRIIAIMFGNIPITVVMAYS